jgi:hypothetical protein
LINTHPLSPTPDRQHMPMPNTFSSSRHLASSCSARCHIAPFFTTAFQIKTLCRFVLGQGAAELGQVIKGDERGDFQIAARLVVLDLADEGRRNFRSRRAVGPRPANSGLTASQREWGRDSAPSIATQACGVRTPHGGHSAAQGTLRRTYLGAGTSDRSASTSLVPSFCWSCLNCCRVSANGCRAS